MDRRMFLKTGVGLAGASLLNRSAAAGDGAPNFKAVAFDAFSVFDPRPVAALCETLFPGRGGDLAATWRARQFEYTWLRTVSQRYVNFERVTADALTYAVKMLKLEAGAEQRAQLLQAYFTLKAWPDAAPALEKLKSSGMRLALLSNFTPDMLDGCVKASGLDGIFEQALSTDAAQTFKPDPRAYALGVDTLKLPREAILFAPFAGWDAAGGKAFGYTTFWVDRTGLPPEELGATPDATGANLADLLAFVS
jgi:2-haloacid dehalogenase